MKKNTLNSLFGLALVLVVGCTPKKVIVETPPVVTTPAVVKADEKPQNLALLKSKNLNFNTLSLKGKTKLTLDGDDQNVTLSIRILKDKKIWVSVTGLAGIEGVRAVITPDSLMMRNNLQKTYLKKPFNYIYGFTNKQVNFGLLQSIFAGNTIAEFTTEKSALVQDNGVWVLSGTSGTLNYQSVFNTLLKVAETTLNDANAGQALKVTYGNYTPVNAALFPSSLKISSMSGAKKIDLTIEFNKIESNIPLEFPFSVPKNYELIN
ncbi:MAG: DUF4292 domain-containing protein [Pedobacter sp.]|nr:DUF4292 domain-containing protein [Pedobacter sp.]MDQ8052922.1 DUF4292 domain-containing protein [Pedobacter sp.]